MINTIMKLVIIVIIYHTKHKRLKLYSISQYWNYPLIFSQSQPYRVRNSLIEQ